MGALERRILLLALGTRTEQNLHSQELAVIVYPLNSLSKFGHHNFTLLTSSKLDILALS